MSEEKETILQNIQNGNLQEFEKLFKEYYPLLCHYALRFVKDSDQAEEIVQELFCQLWENRKELKIHTSLKAYLYKSTYFNSLQVLRKRGIKNQYVDYVKNHKSEQSQPNNLESDINPNPKFSDMGFPAQLLVINILPAGG